MGEEDIKYGRVFVVEMVTAEIVGGQGNASVGETSRYTIYVEKR